MRIYLYYLALFAFLSATLKVQTSVCYDSARLRSDGDFKRLVNE
jgi:hypothetical protein